MNKDNNDEKAKIEKKNKILKEIEENRLDTNKRKKEKKLKKKKKKNNKCGL